MKRVNTQMNQRPALEDDTKLQNLIFAMRDEIEQKKEIYGDERLQVLQNAIDQIVDKKQNSSADTYKMINKPVQRPLTQQSGFQLET